MLVEAHKIVLSADRTLEVELWEDTQDTYAQDTVLILF